MYFTGESKYYNIFWWFLINLDVTYKTNIKKGRKKDLYDGKFSIFLLE